MKDEVLVVFNNVRTRDLVASYASNLADFRHQTPPVNFRMEFPDHLRGVFRTLESHGHLLRGRLGKGMRRNIKFDDQKKSLYMDIFDPNNQDWLRIDPEFAAEEVELQRPRSNPARERLGSRTSHDGDSFVSAASTLSSGRKGSRSKESSSRNQDQPPSMDISPSKENAATGGWSGPTR